jgi:hypothetical protein
MMRGGELTRPTLVAVSLALALGACASSSPSTAKLSSKALCENAGGKYAQGTCQPGSAKKASEMCVGYGGLYMVDEDLCHIPIKQ